MRKLSNYAEMIKKIKSPLIIPKAWNYIKYKIIKRHLKVKYYTPQIANVMMTNRCNLRCSYCGLVGAGVFEAQKEELTLEMIKKAFTHKLLKNVLLVDLAGGEPLLNKDLIPIVKFLSSRGFLTNIVTNGLILLNKIEELKNAGITSINISIYPENFEKLKTSLEQINKVFPVYVSFVLTKTILENNLNFIFNAIDLSIESGCKNFRFRMYRQMSKNLSYDDIIMEDSPIFKEFKYGIERKYKQFVHFNTAVQNGEKKCPMLWQNAMISSNGSITICCGSFDSLQNLNIFKNTYEEIYNCNQIIDIRKNLLDNSIPPLEMCRNCGLLSDPGW
jgi:MoaA/NifB/PqqE/SkfB family radical SAM enzyme